MSLDNYIKSRVVGKGSYGEVFLVKHKKDKKQYVMKQMDMKNASKRERRAAEQEAKLLSKLRHPNIVSYKDSIEGDDGYLYIVMGFCEGGDLYTHLKQLKGSVLDEYQIVEWFVQIAMALQYMHERNILHRDLKTQNIFLTKSKIIKVGDLGIARVLDSSCDMATTLIGTPYYMSPELFSNKPYNHKSDVWALGCCVYEMSTLKHAFNAKDMNSLVYKILRNKTPSMPKHYSPQLITLIKSMLNHNPDRRPNVSRILRDPYIKKNIAIFLEGTRKSQKSGADNSQGKSRSKFTAASKNSSTESNTPTQPDVHLDPLQVQPELEPIVEEIGHQSGDSFKDPPSHKKPPLSSAIRSPHASPHRSSSQQSPHRSPHHSPTKQRSPKPLPKARKLPSYPVSVEPLKSDDIPKQSRAVKGGESKSLDAGLIDNNKNKGDIETPRSLNLSARARRRERKENATPRSSRSIEVLKPRRHSQSEAASRVCQSEDSSKVLRPHSADSARRNESKVIKKITDELDSKNSEKVSNFNETSSTSSSDLEEEGQKPNRQEREMNDFISVLDSTLQIANKVTADSVEDVSDTEEEVKTLVPSKNEPVSAQSVSAFSSATYVKPKSKLNNGPLISVPEIGTYDPDKNKPNDPAMTLGTSGRLMNRIAILKRDCIKGLGIEKLKKAYDILDNIDGEDMELQLLLLLGKDNFDQYAGKIWQLKFCEEAAFGLE